MSMVIAATDKIGLFLFTVRRASFAFPWTEESLAKEVECSKVIQCGMDLQAKCPLRF